MNAFIKRPSSRFKGIQRIHHDPAVIVSTARTPLAKSWKGAFNMTHGATLGGHAVKHAIQRAGIDPGAGGRRHHGLRQPRRRHRRQHRTPDRPEGRLPITVSGMTVNRFCSSGLQTIAMAAQRIIAGEGDIYVAGGVESISCVQQEMNLHMLPTPGAGQAKARDLLEHAADRRAGGQALQHRPRRDGRVRRRQPAKGLPRPRPGLFEAEIAPITVTAGVADKVMGLITKQVTVSKDEGIREGTTKEGISGIKPALPGGVISAGNASQFSDGAGACVVVMRRPCQQSRA
jgi:acetyl-CoA C-acetyltransferase